MHDRACRIVPSRDLKDVQREIQALMRNIVASVAFLPLLSEPCWLVVPPATVQLKAGGSLPLRRWELLVYTSVDAEVPTKWEASDPKHVMNPQTVKLRSFDTSVGISVLMSCGLSLTKLKQIHRVDGVVSYKFVPE